MNDSRLPGFYKLKLGERIEALAENGWLSASDAQKLRDGRHVLSSNAADKMIENVLGVFGLPFAIAPNFLVNGRDVLVPLVVEEPSIVAALSSAARLACSAPSRRLAQWKLLPCRASTCRASTGATGA